jgi:GT2 family glycosyltransferase
VGELDERFVWGWEDVDFALRVRQAGYRLLLVPRVFVRHAGSRTIRAMPSARRRRTDRENRALARAKWSGSRWGLDLARIMAELPSPWIQRTEPPPVLVTSAGPGSRQVRCLRALDRFPAGKGEVRLVGIRHGWGRSINEAADSVRAPWLALVDEAVVVERDWYEGLVAAAKKAPRPGVVAALVRGARLSWQDAARRRPGAVQLVHHLEGFCALLPREVFTRVGGFDERFCWEDGWADLCLRLIQGGFNLALARGVVAELGSRAALGNREQRAADRALLLDKWAGHPLFTEGLRA